MAAGDHVDLLLVEDSPDQAELTLRALRVRGLDESALVLRDGAEALDFLFCTGAWADRSPNGGPRLILLDLKLPKVDGLEVLRRIKADERTAATPVVILTSSAEERDILESYRLGANSYIVKPVDSDSFARAIRDVGLYWMQLNKPPE